MISQILKIRHWARLTPLALLLAACGGDDTAPVQLGPTFTMSPSDLTLRAGDTASVTMSTAGPVDRSQLTLTWTAAPAAVVRVDSTFPTALRVRVRAVAPGNGALTFTIGYQGQSATGSVPVAVR